MVASDRVKDSINCIKKSGISTSIISRKTKEIDPDGKGVAQSTIEHWILGLSSPTYSRILLVNEAINDILQERVRESAMPIE